MATEYHLSVATPQEPQPVVQLLAEALRLEQQPDGFLVGPGILLGVRPMTGLRRTVLREAFGFDPSLSILFRMYNNAPDDEYSMGKHILIRATMLVLERDPGDAVLLFNGEQVILQRLQGRLALNHDWQEWTSYQLLADVTLPYTLRALPSPLL